MRLHILASAERNALPLPPWRIVASRMLAGIDQEREDPGSDLGNTTYVSAREIQFLRRARRKGCFVDLNDGVFLTKFERKEKQTIFPLVAFS